jgi:hypothetical protein
MDGVESDLRRMEVKRWRIAAEDREEWQFIYKHTTAKTVTLQIPHYTVRNYCSLYFVKHTYTI